MSKSLESGISLLYGGYGKGVCSRVYVYVCGFVGVDKEVSFSFGYFGV